MPTSRPPFRVLLCLTAWTLVAWTAPVRPQPLAEYDVKAAFLYNFVKFVTWPDHAFQDRDQPVMLCLAGVDPFAGALDGLVEGERAGDRALVVERLPSPAAPVSRCHLLFVPGSEHRRQRQWLAAAAGAPVLTVGETADFLEAGGIVQFVLEEQHVRFEIHPAPAEASGLLLNARLLQVARIVTMEAPR